MSMLKVEDLHVYYGSIHAIKGISFEVEEGEIVTLIGANGAGKSTTLNTVSGLLKPRSGSIEFEGKNIVNVPAHKIVSHGMALCPEGRRVFLQMTVQENLEMGGYTRNQSEIAGSIDDVYQRFPRLKERYKQTAGTLKAFFYIESIIPGTIGLLAIIPLVIYPLTKKEYARITEELKKRRAEKSASVAQ